MVALDHYGSKTQGVGRDQGKCRWLRSGSAFSLLHHKPDVGPHQLRLCHRTHIRSFVRTGQKTLQDSAGRPSMELSHMPGHAGLPSVPQHLPVVFFTSGVDLLEQTALPQVSADTPSCRNIPPGVVSQQGPQAAVQCPSKGSAPSSFGRF